MKVEGAFHPQGGWEAESQARSPLSPSREAPFSQPPPRTQWIYLADMCGDGLTDSVRLRNGEVCYGPNLGYGRFGAGVTMDCKLGGAHIRPVGKRDDVSRGREA